jgi:hypothetical protein
VSGVLWCECRVCSGVIQQQQPRAGCGQAVHIRPLHTCSPPPCAVALDKWTKQADTERGLVNILLGTACFTTAISALNRECSQLSNEQRCWLALQFTMCFQRASGFKVGARGLGWLVNAGDLGERRLFAHWQCLGVVSMPRV